MSSRILSKRVACRSSSVHNSYAEISRFIRTRHHGITARIPLGPRNGAMRTLSSGKTYRQNEVSEDIRKALDGYKATIQSKFSAAPSAISGLSTKPIDSKVTLTGYLGSRRDISKNLSFALLRSPSQSHCVQLISNGKKTAESENEVNAHVMLRSLREWTPIQVKGVVKKRDQPSPEDTVSGMSLINDVEVVIQSIEPLNEISKDIILKDDVVFNPEQRHLQLRTNHELRNHLLFRDKVTGLARNRLRKSSFVEFETPILFKSTPEGAREFLVPTRTKGMAYALPQSPQQYKQILMASGVGRYFQFARCFRDEDLRADRQPEFTQLDLEMGFEGEEGVMKVIEDLLLHLWERSYSYHINTPLPRMTYQEAMASYGSDKPDLRFEMKIHSITDRLPADLISKITGLETPVVEAFKMKISSDPKSMKKFVSEFLESPEGKPFLDNPAGQPGVFVADASQPLNGLGTLGYAFVMDYPEGLAVDHGELLILQARKDEPFAGGSTPIGNLRLALHKAAVAQGLLEKPRGFKFVWINDFPLFSPSNDADPGQGGAAGLSSTHHPFTAPKTAADVELLLTAPEKAIAAHYDIVVNGVELGGGSRRIHNADVQEFVFRDVLKMKTERIEDFRHLLNVLRSGCPPHAGIALGWDRLIAVMRYKDSVRDVIAFPKSGKGEDMLVKSPNQPTKEQLGTYHLQLQD